MIWTMSLQVADRFFILRDWNEMVQVDIVDGELVADRELTEEEKQYFKLDYGSEKPKSKCKSYTIPSSINTVIP